MQENEKDIEQPSALDTEQTDNALSDAESTETDIGDSSEVGAEESDVLDAFSFKDESSDEKKKDKPKKVGMVRKQIIMISVFAAVALILTLVYFLVLKPIFDERTKEEEEEPEPLIEGEVRDSGGVSILMFPHVEKSNLNKVTVDNAYGGYTLKREGTGDDTFIIAEHPGAPIEAETVSSVVVATGYSVIMSRVTENCPDEELYKYGLGPSDSYTTVTVEDLSGNQYVYYVGSLIPSAGGYYCRYSTRNAVYIINYNSGSTINQSSQSLLSPMLGYPLDSESATMIDFFAVSKNGEDFISFEYDATESTETSKSIYTMVYPGDYIINSDTVAASVTATLASLEGSMVIEAGNGTSAGLLYKNEKLMAEYGFHDLENPAYELFYEYGNYSSYIIFTEAGIDGYYYAYSYLWDTIVLVAETSVPYLSWSLLDYMDTSLFAEEISKVSSITVSGVIDSAGKVYDINEKIFYKKLSDGTLYCEAESTGWKYEGNYSGQNYAQSFYITVALLNIEGYASEQNFDKSQAEEYARIVVEMNDGTVNTYVFYKSGGYCYYEINGVGEFYVLTRQVNKVLIDAVRAANNCAVDWQAEYAEYPSENELLNKK